MLSYKALGRNIQMARMRRGLTQEQVAVALKISQNYYGRYERGEVKPNLSRLEEICEILSTPIEEMFHGTYDPEQFEKPLPPDETAVGIAKLLSGCGEKKRKAILQVCRTIAAMEEDE